MQAIKNDISVCYSTDLQTSIDWTRYVSMFERTEKYKYRDTIELPRQPFAITMHGRTIGLKVLLQTNQVKHNDITSPRIPTDKYRDRAVVLVMLDFSATFDTID